MKLNLTIGVLVGALSVFSLSATAGLSTVSFLQAISGQVEPTVQNVSDAEPGKNLANKTYIRSITGAVNRLTPESHSYNLNIADSVKLYTNQFKN